MDSSDAGSRRRHAAPRALPESPENTFAVSARLCAVLVPLSVLLSGSGALNSTVSQWVDDLAQLAGGLFATWAYARTGIGPRRRERPRNSRPWRALMFLGIGGWTCGQAVWSWYQLMADRPIPSPSPADVGYFLLPVFAVPALLVLPTAAPSSARVPGPMPAARDDRRARLLVTMDATIIVTSLFLLTWSTALGAIVRAGASTPAAFAVAVAYPVTDLVMVVLVLLSAIFRRPCSTATLLLLGAGLVALSVSDSLFLYLVSAGAGDMPPLFDIGFVAGPVLLGLAALVPEPGQRRSRAPRRTRVETWFDFLPYVPLGGIGLLVILQQASGLRLGRGETYGLIVLVGFVIARQLLTLLENRELLRRVQEGQDRLHHQAYHDWLTELPNLAMFRDRLDRALDRHRETGDRLALLFCDLDDFKYVNDSLGHAAGDELLRVVASRLRQCVRAGDTVARVGGDEFAVVLEDEGGSPQAVAERVLAALAEPVSLRGRSAAAHASIGLVVLAPGESPETTDDLLHQADAAMYEAKRAGKNRLVVLHQGVVAAPQVPGQAADDVPDHTEDEDPPRERLGAVHTGPIPRRSRPARAPRSEPPADREPSSTGSGGITIG